jgi:hypothetical protein
VDEREVGSGVGQRGGHQGQLVVVHDDDRPLGGLGRHRLGERLVDGPERPPRLPPRPVEARPSSGVGQAVVEEPEGAVGDDVVVGPVAVGVDHQ